MLNQQQQIFEQIKKANNILITFSKAWNGDSVASSLALFLFLKKLGKTVDLVAEKNEQSTAFAFLPAYSEIKYTLNNLRQFIISLDIRNTKVSQIKYKVEKNTLDFIVSPEDGFFTTDDITAKSSGFRYDLIITLDAQDLESLGTIYDTDTEFFYEIPIINIDHQASNEQFGQINLIELTSVATAEILFALFEGQDKTLIDENIATCLLAGMISKTRSFKTQNVTPAALTAVSQLISLGGRREEIVNHLYRSRGLNVLKLWGVALARLNGKDDDKIIWTSLFNTDFTKTNSNPNDLEEVVDELIVNIPQAKIIIIFYESLKEEQLLSNVLVYSIKNLNALSLLKEYNPTGLKNLAKATIERPIKEVEQEIVQVITDKLSKLPQ